MIVSLLAAVHLQSSVHSADPAAAASAELARRAGEAAADRPSTPFRCVRDGSTPEINACGALDLEAEQDRMEIYLQAATARARRDDELDRAFGGPSAQRGYLDASQSAWKAYADITCNGVMDDWKDGSIRTIMYFSCMIRMTRERTHVIWRDHLTYVDSTPPILPEPVGPPASN